MITMPANFDAAPIVLILNAGLLHRSEPYRLNVLISRLLASIGYICVRVDLSGKGDTPSRENMINRESVALDWGYIQEALKQKFGKRTVIIMGLCSGADNAIKLTKNDPTIKGLILLDPLPLEDKGFKKREIVNFITNFSLWHKLPGIILKPLITRIIGSKNKINLRDEPTSEDMQDCFKNIIKRNGKVLAVFTSHERERYNQVGQFAKTLSIMGLNDCCDEVFWPHVEHLYTIQQHRDELISEISKWGKLYFNYFKNSTEKELAEK